MTENTKEKALQGVNACAEELKTRFGLSGTAIESIMHSVATLSEHAEPVIQLIALTESVERGIADRHDVYHQVDLAFATAYLRLVEECASSCPLHGDKYATL